jgi:CheY-like chemotaxis protein
MKSRGENPVLIVEDDPDTREALEVVLVEDGYLVSTVSDGADALAFLRLNSRPCVVVLDLMLPHIGGEEVLHEMARDPRLSDIPVIVTTGKGGREPVPAYPQVRVILRKPFPFLRLIKEIERACGHADQDSETI